MKIFDYDKYLKIGFGFDWAEGCKNHRVEGGFTISDWIGCFYKHKVGDIELIELPKREEV